MSKLKLFCFICILLLWTGSDAVTRAEEILRFGRFGNVTIYSQSTRPSHVVLFVSGDGGWNLGVIDMAKALSSFNALVVGIDITHYMKELERSSEACVYPAADFELLSKFVQKKLGYPGYRVPLLVGYSSGATLVYATLVQAPPNTFLGAISLGFCPDLQLTKPLCRGYGLEWKPGPKGKGYSFLPARKIRDPWIALQGTIDQVCDPLNTEKFVKQVEGGEIIILPKVGHGFSVPKNWMPRFKEAFQRLVDQRETPFNAGSNEMKDLPLIEVPPRKPGLDILAVFISGDGGWAGLDQDLAARLAAGGIAIVGLDSLQYFWRARTPDEASRDLERILRHYCAAWNMSRVALIGYSMGADVLPFMANRLSRETLEKVKLIALLGPGKKADFEFHLKEWAGVGVGNEGRPIYPEVEKLKGMDMFCFYGEKEEESLCRTLDPGLWKVIEMKGGHHFAGNYEYIADIILKELGEQAP